MVWWEIILYGAFVASTIDCARYSFNRKYRTLINPKKANSEQDRIDPEYYFFLLCATALFSVTCIALVYCLFLVPFFFIRFVSSLIVVCCLLWGWGSIREHRRTALRELAKTEL